MQGWKPSSTLSEFLTLQAHAALKRRSSTVAHNTVVRNEMSIIPWRM
jgi:hypothetical protein